MRQTSESLVKKAREIAKEMLDLNQTIRELPFGTTNECLYISLNPALLRWTDIIELNEHRFYIGTKIEVAG